MSDSSPSASSTSSSASRITVKLKDTKIIQPFESESNETIRIKSNGSDKMAQYESFQPLSISKLKDTIRITWSDLKQTLREAYDKQITSWSDQFNVLPGSIRYPIAAFLVISLLLTFILLLIYGIKNSLNFQSLSYSRYDPPNNQFVPEGCKQIPIDITGDFYADSNGYWSGSLNYQYTKAIYYTTLSNFADDSNGDSGVYEYSISATRNTLSSRVDPEMEKENLGINLLYWTSFVQMDKERSGNANRFKLNADPNVIFDRQKYVVSVSSKHGVCNKAMSVSFDYNYHLIVTISDIGAFLNDTVCTKALSQTSLFNLGYDPAIDGNSFNMRFDIRSMVTSMAANLDILNAWYHLEKIDALSFTSSATSQSIESYVDPAYLGMSPITCIDSNPYETADHCAVTYGYGVLLPVFNQLGYATQVYNNLATGNLSYCNCSEWADYNEEQKYNCNLFNFLTGFIFWNDEIYSPDSLFELTNLESSYINRKAYDAQYFSSIFYHGNQSETGNYFDFCHTSASGDCSLLTIAMFDNALALSNQALSENANQLVNGSCTASASVSDSAWDNLLSIPPSGLYNDYVSCKQNFSTVFINQAGIAVANTKLLIPMLVIFILFLLQLFQQLTGSAIPYKYSDARKQAALDKLAITLLLHQDKAIVYNDVDVELTKKMNEEIKDASKFDTYRISNNRSYMKQEAGRSGPNETKATMETKETKETNPMHGI